MVGARAVRKPRRARTDARAGRHPCPGPQGAGACFCRSTASSATLTRCSTSARRARHDDDTASNGWCIVLILLTYRRRGYRRKHFWGRSRKSPRSGESAETVATSRIADIWGHWYKGRTAFGAAQADTGTATEAALMGEADNHQRARLAPVDTARYFNRFRELLNEQIRTRHLHRRYM